MKYDTLLSILLDSETKEVNLKTDRPAKQVRWAVQSGLRRSLKQHNDVLAAASLETLDLTFEVTCTPHDEGYTLVNISYQPSARIPFQLI